MGGSAEGSSLLLALDIPHNFYHGCSSQLMRAPSRVNSGCSSLFATERILSMCDVLVDTFLLVVGETSLVWVGISSVIVASGSSGVATKDSVGPL